MLHDGLFRESLAKVDPHLATFSSPTNLVVLPTGVIKSMQVPLGVYTIKTTCILKLISGIPTFSFHFDVCCVFSVL